ncbi:hypothetical protein ACQ4PT_045290 [Festuca glaucescens]
MMRRYAVVEELSALGAAVHTCSRKEAELAERLKEWEAKGFRVTGTVCDVSVREQRERLIRAVADRFAGKLKHPRNAPTSSSLLDLFTCMFSSCGLRDAELLESFGPCLPVRRPCDSSPLGFDAFRLPLECCSGLAPLLPDAVDDKVASPEGLQSPISDVVEGFGLAELFVEAPVSLSVEHSRLEASAFEHVEVVDVLAAPLVPFVEDPEVADSTKLCDFLANLASKKLALMSPLCEPLEEIPAPSVVVPETVPAEDIQVDPGDPAADKLNVFLSSVFRPAPPPILASPPSRRARAPKEVATTPRRSGRIEKQKQSRKDATTQELLARVLGVLKENAEFDDNALAAFIDKFKTPLSPRSIAMLGSLVKNVKKPKGNKVGAKKKAVEIT